YTPAGVGSVFTGSGLNAPLGIAFDSAGNLYAANYSSNAIEKFTPGGVASFFANTGLNGPAGLAFDSAGNLYASIFAGNTIEKYTPGGAASLFANSGLNNPRYLAFTNDAGVPLALPPTAVPEPTSLSVLAVSAVMMLRRRCASREF